MIKQKEKLRVIAKLMGPNGYSPNNANLPFLIYKAHCEATADQPPNV